MLTNEAQEAGNPLIPLVRQLTRLVAETDAASAGYVHWGATSQDVMDTALVLQMRTAAGAIVATLGQAAEAAAALAERYAATPIAGRTWLQQATPTTFGAKAAGWVQALDRVRGRLAAALTRPVTCNSAAPRERCRASAPRDRPWPGPWPPASGCAR